MSRENNRVFVVDTSILVEYLDESSPLSRRVEILFEKTRRKEISLYTTSLVIAGLLYVTSRLYKEMHIPNPNERAKEYIVWLQRYIGLNVADISDRLAIEIGEIKKKLRIALTDCSVIAYAKTINAIPLFRNTGKKK